MSTRVYTNNVLTEQWDDTTRTYTSYNASGQQTSTRPYTADENATADAQATGQAAASNQKSIQDALASNLTDVQTILDTANATINASPAAYIKTMARNQKRIIRLLTNRLDSAN